MENKLNVSRLRFSSPPLLVLMKMDMMVYWPQPLSHETTVKQTEKFSREKDRGVSGEMK